MPRSDTNTLLAWHQEDMRDEKTMWFSSFSCVTVTWERKEYVTQRPPGQLWPGPEHTLFQFL